MSVSNTGRLSNKGESHAHSSFDLESDTGEGVTDKTSKWQCYKDGYREQGTVTIWWGHTATDAAWACNAWKKTGSLGPLVAATDVVLHIYVIIASDRGPTFTPPCA